MLESQTPGEPGTTDLVGGIHLELLTGTEWVKARMALMAGFMGVVQDADTLALRPVPGWGVHEDPGLDAMLRRIEDEHAVEPPRDEPPVGKRWWNARQPGAGGPSHPWLRAGRTCRPDGVRGRATRA